MICLILTKILSLNIRAPFNVMTYQPTILVGILLKYHWRLYTRTTLIGTWCLLPTKKSRNMLEIELIIMKVSLYSLFRDFGKSQNQCKRFNI